MRSANGSDFTRMARGTKPVVNRRADAAARDWWFAGTMVTGNQEQDSLAPPNRPVERPIDGQPRAVEIEPMKVEHLIGFDRTGPQAAIPRPVKSGSNAGADVANRSASFRHGSLHNRLARTFLLLRFRRRCFCLFSREWRDRRRYPRPQSGFFRAEGAHAQQRPSAGGAAPGRMPTCRRQSPWRPDHRPKRYRSGSRP